MQLHKSCSFKFNDLRQMTEPRDKYIFFEDALKSVSLNELQDVIAQAVGELIHKNVACNISNLEMKNMQGASIKLTLNEKEDREDIPF